LFTSWPQQRVVVSSHYLRIGYAIATIRKN